MSLSAAFYTHAAAALGYAIFLALLAVRSERSRLTLFLGFAAAMTGGWALSWTFFDLGWLPAWVPLTASVLRDGSWLATVLAILSIGRETDGLWRRLAAAAAVVVAVDAAFRGQPAGTWNLRGHRGRLPAHPDRHHHSRLILVENLLRNVSSDEFWAVKSLGIGLVAVFVFNLVLGIPQFLTHMPDDGLIAAQPVVFLIVLPLFVVSAIRNPTLRLGIHSSRRVVFHTTTLVIAGILLQGTAVAAYYIRNYGGTTGTVLSVLLVFAALVAFAVAMTSGSVRSALRTLHQREFLQLQIRLSRRMAEIHPVALRLGRWRGCDARSAHAFRIDGQSRRRALVLSRTVEPVHAGRPLVVSHRACAVRPRRRSAENLRRRKHGLSRPDVRGRRRSGKAVARAVSFCLACDPLALPLDADGHRRPQSAARAQDAQLGRQQPDWPRFDAAAAYLVQEETAQALTDARQLEEFNKRIAFILHDIKNTIGQLSLIARNAEQFGDNKEFRKDMVLTIEHSVEKLHELLARLRGEAGALPSGAAEGTDLTALVADFVARKRAIGLGIAMSDTEHPPSWRFPTASFPQRARTCRDQCRGGHAIRRRSPCAHRKRRRPRARQCR